MDLHMCKKINLRINPQYTTAPGPSKLILNSNSLLSLSVRLTITSAATTESGAVTTLTGAESTLATTTLAGAEATLTGAEAALTRRSVSSGLSLD